MADEGGNNELMARKNNEERLRELKDGDDEKSKRRRLEDNNDFLASIQDLLTNILGFLAVKDVMRSRRINKKMMEAVKKTIVPLDNFCVESVEGYNALNVMTRVLPNLQQITLSRLQSQHKYNDGEDPDEEEAARTETYTTHDIEVVSYFSKLRELRIFDAGLNGRYPFLFSSNSFPLLQKLSIQRCGQLKWDLEMLVGLPLLTELYCWENHCMTGNISSLRVLKDTLQKVAIDNCENVEGSLMDLADFPLLKELDLDGTAVTGDFRDVGEHDFSSLESLILPKGVYGAKGSELQRISDGPDVARAVYLLSKQNPSLDYLWYVYPSKDSPDWYESDWTAVLSKDSPDWYRSRNREHPPPFYILFVKAGSRIGYRWVNCDDHDPCEVNWLDPEPDRESSDYAKYTEELQQLNSCVNMYRGFHQPPTEEEYNSILERICDLCGSLICDYNHARKCDKCGIQTCGIHDFRIDACSYCEVRLCFRCQGHGRGLLCCDGCDKRSCRTGNCHHFKFCNDVDALCPECYVEKEESEEEDFEDEDDENGEVSG